MSDYKHNYDLQDGEKETEEEELIEKAREEEKEATLNTTKEKVDGQKVPETLCRKASYDMRCAHR